MKSLTPKNARWYSVFGLPVLMCVEYISALKVATSYKFLFIAFLSIKYSALVFFVRYATFIPVFENINIYQCVTIDCEIETGRGNGA
ncbi:TPA: hypothetical protein MAW35_005685 [Klebsiella pneumoniae]|nr:hypothetical protein [Klebsiella pneumoniae]HBS9294910.1 hypothetical protein [Klebsiella pneumoniae]